MLTPELIITTVCQNLSLDPEKLKSKIRSTEYIDGRFLSFYFIHKLLYPRYVGWKEIANLLGKKQHGSAMNGVKKAKNLLEIKHRAFSNKYEKINQSIKLI